MKFSIRMATKNDVPAMLQIYTPYVTNTTISFEWVPPSLEEFSSRHAQITEAFPWLVCETNGGVIGYAYASRFGQRAGYDWSAEVSIYLDQAERHRGIGGALYSPLLRLLEKQGYCEAYARIALPNPASEAFHKKFGFVCEGVLKRPGRKLGKIVGVAYYAKTLFAANDPPPPLPLSKLDPQEIQEFLAQ